MTTRRFITISCVIILFCMTAILGASYALFNETISVGNHLQAGNLDAKLERTKLEYATLNSEGVLVTTTDTTPTDFTGATGENIFGLTGTNKVVPGSFYEATMELTNEGTVAFDYTIAIKLLGDSNELAKQLKVTIKSANGEKTYLLSELIAESGADRTLNISEGRLMIDGTQGFSVRVEFIDSTANNDAQNQSCAFDLVVTAVQATE